MLYRILVPVACLLVLLCTPAAHAQKVSSSGDDSTLKQIIIFGRHGVRSAALPDTVLSQFAVRKYPEFGVPPGYLTPHGYQAEVLLGNYFHDYLVDQGLLTGNAQEDAKHAYFRANSIQRSNVSAAALGAALLPGVPTPVHSYPLGTPDPVFDPISAKVVVADRQRAAAEVKGIFNGDAALHSAYAPEFELIRSVLFDYPLTEAAPPAPTGLIDATRLAIPLTPSATPATSAVLNVGGLYSTLYAADPFVMEYADNLPLDQVAWGQLTKSQLSQQTRIINLAFAIEVTSPYLNTLQSSNAAAHILRSMQQATTGSNVPGAFGAPDTRLIVINSSDAYVAGVAGLLRAHWLLRGYQPDYCAPGGSLVFELRQAQNGKYFVRVFYTAQNFDQLRTLTALTLDNPPATMQLEIPGSGDAQDKLDLDFATFQTLLQSAITEKYVQDPAVEQPPAVLTGVPLS